VSSRSGVATLRTAIHLLLTYLLTYSVTVLGLYCTRHQTIGSGVIRYSAPDRRAEYCDDRVCLSLLVCVFVCPRSYLRNYTSDLHQIFAHVTYGRGSVLLWQHSDKLCTSGFMDDVIFAHKPGLLDVATHLKRSAHAALGLAINCAQQ